MRDEKPEAKKLTHLVVQVPVDSDNCGEERKSKFCANVRNLRLQYADTRSRVVNELHRIDPRIELVAACTSANEAEDKRKDCKDRDRACQFAFCILDYSAPDTNTERFEYLFCPKTKGQFPLNRLKGSICPECAETWPHVEP